MRKIFNGLFDVAFSVYGLNFATLHDFRGEISDFTEIYSNKFFPVYAVFYRYPLHQRKKLMVNPNEHGRYKLILP